MIPPLNCLGEKVGDYMKDVRTINITFEVSDNFEIKNVSKLLKDVMTVLNSAHHLGIISEPIHKTRIQESITSYKHSLPYRTKRSI